VRFDDRLLTVLNQPAEDRHDAAVRWRLLVDLVARAGPDGTGLVVTQALDAIRSEAERIEENSRAAAARAVAALPLPLGLLEIFASDSLAVSAPVLAAATLDRDQWGALFAAADAETRSFISALHPEVGAVPPGQATPVRPQSLPPEPALQPSPSLHDLVERIERRRRLRSAQAAGGSTAPLEPPALFKWECGPGGEIAWVEGAPRGPLIGRTIAKAAGHDDDHIDQHVVRAFAVRAPFRDALMAIGGAGPIAGEWKISGVPAFEPVDGRFAGYRGVALREAPPPPSVAEAMPGVLADPDLLRELVHEIKTPLNAIIGFGEIIEGQYLGPADRGYRDRAGEIVRQARLLLTAIDDLDFAAKVNSPHGLPQERVDLGALLDRAANEVRDVAARAGIEVDVMRARGPITAAVEPELANRLLLRLFAALAERAEAGERLQVSAEQGSDGARISVSRPAALRIVPDAELFGPKAGSDGGFSLRLARGLARVAGANLVGSRSSIALLFRRP
jgi:hypothetical protein